MKFRLALANFLFQFPVGLVLVHGLFLRVSAQNNLESAIIISMGVYAALQYGGVWLVSWIRREYLMNPLLWSIMRLVGGLLYLVDHAIPVVAGVALLGISQALFYRHTRQLASQRWVEAKEQEQMFSLMTFSVNLAFFSLPPLGSFLSKYTSVNGLMMLAITFSIIGSSLIFKFASEGETSQESATETKKSSQTGKWVPNVNIKEFLVDLFLLSSFVVPYGIMMALIPMRTKSLGYGIEMNGNLISLNAVLVLLILGLKIISGKSLFENTKLDQRLFVISSVAWVLVLTAAALPLFFMILSYVIWSVLEAVQLPAIERHIFGNRGYSAKWIDRLFLVDAFGGFVAPPIAALLIAIVGCL